MSIGKKIIDPTFKELDRSDFDGDFKPDNKIKLDNKNKNTDKEKKCKC